MLSLPLHMALVHSARISLKVGNDHVETGNSLRSSKGRLIVRSPHPRGFFFGSPPGTMYLSADMCTFVIAIEITIITTLATLSLELRLVDYAN